MPSYRVSASRWLRISAALSLLLLIGHVREAGSQCRSGSGCPVINEDCRGRRRADCEPCDLGATFSPGGDQGQCSRVSACAAGEGVLVAASNSTDTRCEPCSAGVNFSASDSATEACLPTGSCGYGWGRAADLTAATNISCAACSAGKYSGEISQRPCVTCDANNEAPVRNLLQAFFDVPLSRTSIICPDRGPNAHLGRHASIAGVCVRAMRSCTACALFCVAPRQRDRNRC